MTVDGKRSTKFGNDGIAFPGVGSFGSTKKKI